MTPEEWQKIKEVLHTVLELEPRERRDYLARAYGNQSSVRTEVEELLLSYEEDQAFLEQPVVIDASELADGLASTSWIGRRIGPYEVVEELGEGGMGAVFRAVRADGVYEKQVAIKLIRSGLSTEFFISRFRNEQQILASLEHPNIAHLLDGGVTQESVPYLVLEYVAGVPIDEYCHKLDLSVTKRLELFRSVCSAVQHAHKNLVVHRDLKPGNILVTADGTPKLLDFGISKMLDQQHGEQPADRTLTVMRMMTPDFASPEQVRGDAITTSSDIYSLGVILYLLLTGQRPYRIASTAPHEIIKAICDTDPEKPSTAAIRKLSHSKVASPKNLESTSPASEDNRRKEKLRRALSGDLDNIVLKALRKEPERRYVTVEQFSEDVRRHLENLPVIARKETPAYLASKFILRHKAGVAAGVAIVLTLVAGLAITIREARIAERRFNDVRSLANSLIFDVHDSIKDLPGSTPARKIIVDRALQYLSSLAKESGGDIALQRELATAYERVGLVQGMYLQNSLGDTKGSLDSYQKALQIRMRVDAKSRDWKDRLALAQAHRLVANQQWATGDRRSARQNMDRAIVLSETLDKAHPNDFQVLYELGFDYEVSGDVGYPGDPDGRAKVDKDSRKALAVSESLVRIRPDDLHALDAYAIDLSHIGGSFESTDPKAALPYYQKELEIEQKLHQRSLDIRYGRGVARTYSEIARAYDKMGDYPRALENDVRDLAIYQELIVEDPKNVLLQQGLAIAYVNTAEASAKTGEAAQHLDYVFKSLELMRAVVASAPENKQQRGIFGSIAVAGGTILIRAGKPEAALKVFDEARAIYESFYKADPGDIRASENAAACKLKMGEATAQQGNTKLSAEYFHQALSVVEPMLIDQSSNLSALYTAADAYSGLGDLSLQEARRQGQTAANARANWIEAHSWYLKSLDTWHRIEHPSHEAPNGFDAGDPAIVKKKVQYCARALTGSN